MAIIKRGQMDVTHASRTQKSNFIFFFKLKCLSGERVRNIEESTS
jgi:hypothetical protein